jgi:oxygen-independent coproporphyrinogen-3 oxidase
MGGLAQSGGSVTEAPCPGYPCGVREPEKVDPEGRRGEALEPSVGVYVHVPFCERICPYCDFAVVKADGLPREREDRYVDALLRELERRAPDFSGRRLASLYFGGGTPSLLTPASIERIYSAVRAAFSRAGEAGEADGLQVTLEVNPSNVERSRLPGFHEAGVDRLSIGVQSFDDKVLKRLGRAHRADEARRTLDAARKAGFANLSLDFIYAAPEQTLEILERDLDEAIAFGPEHVSAYELTIEAATPFATAADRGQLRLPNEDLAIEMAETVEGKLSDAGLQRYEISSYARIGRESKHNQRYWQRCPVLGLGVSAVSSDPPRAGAPFGSRQGNLRELGSYLKQIEAGQGAESEAPEVFDAATARGEAVFLALREMRGLDAGAFVTEFGEPPRAFFASEIDALTDGGLLDESPSGDLALTPRGRLLSNSVFERFVVTA